MTFTHICLGVFTYFFGYIYLKSLRTLQTSFWSLSKVLFSIRIMLQSFLPVLELGKDFIWARNSWNSAHHFTFRKIITLWIVSVILLHSFSAYCKVYFFIFVEEYSLYIYIYIIYI